MTSEKCFDEFIYRLSSVLSEERRTNNAEKYIYTQTRSKFLPADAEHPFAFIRLRWLFKPRLSAQWYTANYSYKGRIQYHLYSRQGDTAITAFTKTVILKPFKTPNAESVLLKSRFRAEAMPLHDSLLQFLRLLPSRMEGKRRKNCRKIFLAAEGGQS